MISCDSIVRYTMKTEYGRQENVRLAAKRGFPISGNMWVIGMFSRFIEPVRNISQNTSTRVLSIIETAGVHQNNVREFGVIGYSCGFDSAGEWE